jgi:hypothetical protein
VTVVRHQLESLGIKKITHQHYSGISPDIVRRDPAAACFRVVDDIVMEEGSGVYEFNDGGKRMTALTLVIEKIGGGQNQQWSKTLAATSQEVADDFGYDGDLGPKMKFHFRFNTLQFRTITGKNILNLH